MNPRFRICFALVLSLLLLSTVPAAAETVLGFLEGPVYQGNAGTGAIGFTGWALADSGVRRVTIQVDGVDVGQARHGFSRPIVADLYPGFPDSAGAGFTYHLDSTQFNNTVHQISAKVLTNDGVETIIAGTQGVSFVNSTPLLVPFGRIEQPRRNAQLYGRCNRDCVFDPGNSIYTPVTGWALDLGMEIGDAGMAWVEVMIDGEIYYNTRRDCDYTAALGLHQCYGLPRLDVERGFPFAIDAPNSGFRFLLDIGDLITCWGLNRGHHTLTIRAGDISTQNANIDEHPVFFQCIEDLPADAGLVGNIESPREGAKYSDNILFQGWALALEGVARVDVYVDGQSIGTATFGIDSRPGVAVQFPGYPDVAAPVWALTYDSNNLSEGFHQVQVFVVDTVGTSTRIGERTFFVENRID